MDEQFAVVGQTCGDVLVWVEHQRDHVAYLLGVDDEPLVVIFILMIYLICSWSPNDRFIDLIINICD